MPNEIAYKPFEPIKKIYPGGTFSPPTYSTSLLEWLYLKGQQILISFEGSGGTEDIYYIPEGSTFFVVSWDISIVSEVDGDPFKLGWDKWNSTSTDKNLLFVTTLKNDVTKIPWIFSKSLNFPIKIPGPNYLNIYELAYTTSEGSIFGFLVKNSDIPFF